METGAISSGMSSTELVLLQQTECKFGDSLSQIVSVFMFSHVSPLSCYVCGCFLDSVDEF